MEWWKEILTSSWKAIQADPVVFITGIVVTWPLVWVVAWLFFRSALSGKDERIAALKERVDDYEKRLGRTPGEAKERLDTLERHANLTLGPPWRSLSPKEEARLKDNISKLEKKSIQIMYSNHLGRPLANEFAEIFKSLGWTLNVPVSEGGGLGYGISTGRGTGLAHELKAAIEGATDFLVSVQGPEEKPWNNVFLAVGINANEDGSAPHKTQT
jgi:hypothetical protein